MTAGRSTPAGLAVAVLGIMCWAAGNVMVVEAPLPGLQIAFWRILLGAVVFTIAVYAAGRRLTAGVAAAAPHKCTSGSAVRFGRDEPPS